MCVGNAQEANPSNQDGRRRKILLIWSHARPEQAPGRAPPVINVPALCGAVIGVASFFCPWFRFDWMDATWSRTLWSLFVHNWYDINHLWILGSVLFVLGTIAALVTQMSGMLQVAGLALTVTNLQEISPGDTVLGIGFYMGLLSASIILGSWAYPIGPGLESGAPESRRRFVVIMRGVPLSGTQSVHEKRPLGSRVRQMFHAHGKWISILVAVSVWSVTVVSYETDFFSKDQLLTQVGSSVIIEGSSFGIAFHWDGYLLSLHDGDNGVAWNFSDPELVAGTWCAVDLGERSLGSLSVSLTAVNQNGDLYFGLNDQLVLTAQNGAFFEEDVIYSIWWKTDRMLSWSGIEISFMFHDGDLESWVSHDWFIGW